MSPELPVLSSAPACGSCAHWHKNPVTPDTLGQPSVGECRGAPPQIVAVPVRNPLGQTGLQLSSHYPPVAEGHPVCALFRARLAV
jgi:hypothetical protein